MKLLEKLRSNSSLWNKTKGETYNTLYWQNGYRAFSINSSQVDLVLISYIKIQRKHHGKKSVQDECRKMLHTDLVAYDERYV